VIHPDNQTRKSAMHDQIVPEPTSSDVPTFNIYGVSLQLPMTATQLHSTPRTPPKRPIRKSPRPSTAPAKEEAILLPSRPPSESTASQELPAKLGPIHFDSKRKKQASFPHMQTVDEDDAYPPSAGTSLSLGACSTYPFIPPSHSTTNLYFSSYRFPSVSL